jgi:hypothetical protein
MYDLVKKLVESYDQLDARSHRVMVFAATEREAVQAWNGNTGGGDDRCGY